MTPYFWRVAFPTSASRALALLNVLALCLLTACGGDGGSAPQQVAADTKCTVKPGKYCVKSMRTSCPVAQSTASCLNLACTDAETYSATSEDGTDSIAYKKEGRMLVPTKETATASSMEVGADGLSIPDKVACNQTDGSGTVTFKGAAQSVVLLALGFEGKPPTTYDRSLVVYPDADSPSRAPVAPSEADAK